MDLLSSFCLDIGVMGISQSAAQNKISTARILRRSSRSSSSCISPKVQQKDVLQKKDGQFIPRRRQQSKGRSAPRLKKERPLFVDPIYYAKRPGRDAGRKDGGSRPKTLTQTVPPTSEGCRTSPKNPPTTLHACPCITDCTNEAGYPSAAANISLSLARQSVKMQTDAMGRRPCVMDVILDLQDRARRAAMPEARVATHALAAVRCNYSHCVEDDSRVLHAAVRGPANVLSFQVPGYYNFGDQTSLTRYWADQAARWSNMQVVDEDTGTRLTIAGFPESIERSTA